MKRELLEDFFAERKRKCCRTKHFCAKVYDAFWDGDVGRAVNDLLNDHDFWRMIKTWAHTAFRFCNMSVERLLVHFFIT